MSLRINGSGRKFIKWGVLGVLGCLVLGFFIRVAVWEEAYYRGMEGTERAVATEAEPEEEELVEVEPTVEEVQEYMVAPDRPRYLTIERLGIYNARIISVGINSKGELGTPNNIFDVGWYDASGKPGQGGTMLLDGHNGGPNVYGIFKELPVLEYGDVIQVERGDGKVFKYMVVENVAVSLDESNMYMATAMRSPEAGRESVTIISCTGEWSAQRSTYLSRQFTRAVLTE